MKGLYDEYLIGSTKLDEDVRKLGCISDLVEALNKRGWFLTDIQAPNFKLLVLQLMKDAKFKDVDTLFKIYYEKEHLTLFKRLEKSYPEIKKKLIEACECIDRELYFPAIPLLIITSDYIFKRIVGDSFKNKYANHNENEKEHVLKSSILGVEVALNPKILKYNEISIASNNLLTPHSSKNVNGDLNFIDSHAYLRHSIINGNNTNYGTEINCYKAIGFLEFIDEVRRKDELRIS